MGKNERGRGPKCPPTFLNPLKRALEQTNKRTNKYPFMFCLLAKIERIVLNLEEYFAVFTHFWFIEAIYLSLKNLFCRKKKFFKFISQNIALKRIFDNKDCGREKNCSQIVIPVTSTLILQV